MKKADTAIILAGGRSQRMGIDKQKLEIDGLRVIDFIIDTCRQEFSQVLVVTNKPYLYDDRVQTIQDIYQGRGPMAGLHAGLKQASSSFSFLLACDMPYMNPSYLAYMRDQIQEGDQALVTETPPHIAPFHAFYSKDLIPAIEEFLDQGHGSLQKFLRKQGSIHYISEDKAREFSPSLTMFLNYNTMIEWKSFLKNEKENERFFHDNKKLQDTKNPGDF